MTSYHSHLGTFAGLPVSWFDAARPSQSSAADAVRVDADLGSVGEARFLAKLDVLVAQPWAYRLQALVIGDWGDSHESDSAFITEWLVANAARLPALRALYLGHISVDKVEVSEIGQCDLGPLLAGLPQLEVLRVRGTRGLVFPRIVHDHLSHLAFETGGLPQPIVAAALESRLPALEHLDLWFGANHYGAAAGVADIMPILNDPDRSLRYLGLRNAYCSDDLAAAVAEATIVAGLEVLDLSMGTLTDDGVRLLLGGQALSHLRLLDMSENYLSDGMVRLLAGSGIAFDGTNQRRPSVYDDRTHYQPLVID